MAGCLRVAPRGKRDEQARRRRAWAEGAEVRARARGRCEKLILWRRS
jgi:hypothetical protein